MGRNDGLKSQCHFAVWFSALLLVHILLFSRLVYLFAHGSCLY